MHIAEKCTGLIGEKSADFFVESIIKKLFSW
jgi:hypothetical protein